MTSLRLNPIFFPLSLPTTKTLNLAGTLTLNSGDHYGPSLRRKQPPLPSDSGEQSSNLDRSSFSLTFKIPALRIPSSSSSSLESRLRGHLLNWPRIPNIARVPGDDLDPRIQNLLPNPQLNAATTNLLMTPVLYREKLAKDFNCRGFLRFRNLARMSRPKTRRTRRRVIEGDGKEEREVSYIVREVLGEREGDGDDMSGLIGDEFCRGRWRGPTRLLLLDERYKDKGFEEMPEAVKVLRLDFVWF